MPWYELRLRGRLDPATAEVLRGFRVVEQPSSTVLFGEVEPSAHLPAILAEVQSLGLEFTELHRVPQRSELLQEGELRDSCRYGALVPPGLGEVVVLRTRSSRLPPPVVEVLVDAVRAGDVEVMDVALVERRPDGRLALCALPGLPPELEPPPSGSASAREKASGALEGCLDDLTVADHAVAVSLRRHPILDRLATAAAVDRTVVMAVVAMTDLAAEAEP